MMLSSNILKQEERNWLDLPFVVMVNILNRIGMVDIIQNVEKVCTAWHKICDDPALWKVVNISGFSSYGLHHSPENLDPALWSVVNLNDFSSSGLYRSPENLCRLAVNRSQGQLIDFTVNAYDASTIFSILDYVSERSSQLRRLEMVYNYLVYSAVSLSAALKKFSLLEELNLYFIRISKEEIETAGRYCPMLKTLKVNHVRSFVSNDERAIAIGQNLPKLRHLELIGNSMTNIGLKVILENCLHLETLDLRACVKIDLEGSIGKQCSKQIKYLKLPNDSLEGLPYADRYNDSYDDGYTQHCYAEIDDGYLSQ